MIPSRKCKNRTFFRVLCVSHSSFGPENVNVCLREEKMVKELYEKTKQKMKVKKE